MSDVKHELHRKLQAVRGVLLSKLEGLNEYDMRRPMTRTGTNLLGLVKHVASVEYTYLGDSFKRPPPERISWIEDGSIWESADMWAKPDESSEYLIGLYKRACAHGDQTITDLDLQAQGGWPTGRRTGATQPWVCCSFGWSPRPPNTPAMRYHPRAHRRARRS